MCACVSVRAYSVMKSFTGLRNCADSCRLQVLDVVPDSCAPT